MEPNSYLLHHTTFRDIPGILRLQETKQGRELYPADANVLSNGEQSSNLVPRG